MARAIAICKGGPLDGTVVSVALGDDGQPPPLDGRVDVVGVLYVPGPEVELTEELEGGFVSGDSRIVHDTAFEYVLEGT